MHAAARLRRAAFHTLPPQPGGIVVQDNAVQGTFGSSGSTMGFGSNVTAGNAVIAVIWGTGNETVSGTGVTFTQQTTTNGNGTLYSGTGSSGGSNTITVTLMSGQTIWAGAALEVSGLSIGNAAVVASPVGTGDGATCSITINPTAVGQFIVTSCSGNNNVSGGSYPTSPWTSLDTGAGTVWAWMNATSLAPVTATFTFGTSTFNGVANAAAYNT
jgi:hypothetical protein